MSPQIVTAPGRVGSMATRAAQCWPPPPSPRASSLQQTQGPAPLLASAGALAAAASADWYEAAEGAAVAVPAARGGTGARGARCRAADVEGPRPVTCGLWLARRRLVAVVVGPGGEARRAIRAALTDDARFGLLEYLAAAGAEVVATEALARVDLTPAQAARRGLAVWTAGDALVAALLRAAAIRDPARAAALLARIPVIPLLRSSLRRLAPPDRRQLPLL